MSMATDPARKTIATEEPLEEVTVAEIVPPLREFTQKLAGSCEKFHQGTRWQTLFWVASGLMCLVLLTLAAYALFRERELLGTGGGAFVGVLFSLLTVVGVNSSLWLGRSLFPELLFVRHLLKVQHRRLRHLILLASRLREHRAVTDGEKVVLDNALAEADAVWGLADAAANDRVAWNESDS